MQVAQKFFLINFLHVKKFFAYVSERTPFGGRVFREVSEIVAYAARVSKNFAYGVWCRNSAQLVRQRAANQ